MGRNRHLTVLGYFTPTVALVPSILVGEKSVPSTGGGIGAHMLLRALSRDSMVRFVGPTV
jgi:hypothetical protein